jgi:hypothetical protein
MYCIRTRRNITSFVTPLTLAVAFLVLPVISQAQYNWSITSVVHTVSQSSSGAGNQSFYNPSTNTWQSTAFSGTVTASSVKHGVKLGGPMLNGASGTSTSSTRVEADITGPSGTVWVTFKATYKLFSCTVSPMGPGAQYSASVSGDSFTYSVNQSTSSLWIDFENSGTPLSYDSLSVSVQCTIGSNGHGTAVLPSAFPTTCSVLGQNSGSAKTLVQVTSIRIVSIGP